MAKKSFSLMLDEEMRKKAERLAKAEDRSLGWWIHRLVERELASIDPPGRKVRQTERHPEHA